MLINQVFGEQTAIVKFDVPYDQVKKYFSLLTDTGAIEFVSAHGCAGTGKQQGMREKISLYLDYINRYLRQPSFESPVSPGRFSSPSSSSSSSSSTPYSPFQSSSSLNSLSSPQSPSVQPKMLHFLLGDNSYEHGCPTPNDNTLKSLFHDIYVYANPDRFPWDRVFGILGNHDYNYITPALRYLLYLKANPSKWREITNADNFGLAYNQICQSYNLFRRYAHIYKTPLIPSRYYIVETKFAIYFCLDTNVLLFDKAQQDWLTKQIQEISTDTVKREKFLILVTHQPLQTFGKRGIGNGAAGYYLKNLRPAQLPTTLVQDGSYTQEGFKQLIGKLFPLENLISNYHHKSYDDIVKSLPPYSLLLRRYLERDFSRNGLKFSLVISAHDHFNEVTRFGPDIVQVIAGVMGIEKDSQNDHFMAEQIAHFEVQKKKDTSITKSLQQMRQESLGSPHAEAQIDLNTVSTSENTLTSSDQWALLNSAIRLQITLPLFIVTENKIDIIWQLPEIITQRKYSSSGLGGSTPVSYEVVKTVKTHFSKPISLINIPFRHQKADTINRLSAKIQSRRLLLGQILTSVPQKLSPLGRLQNFFRSQEPMPQSLIIPLSKIRLIPPEPEHLPISPQVQRPLDFHTCDELSSDIKSAFTELQQIRNKKKFLEHKNILLDLWCLVESLKVSIQGQPPPHT